ncbi:MAG: hypothetical protein K0U24_08960 [Gammaproteobacteria bacterium]|nr:hypothetical protein [Gammaproteobacteria bacterium]MCH9764332.1 hypothetical protein [Gammaproteobacteria bacterium]
MRKTSLAVAVLLTGLSTVSVMPVAYAGDSATANTQGCTKCNCTCAGDGGSTSTSSNCGGASGTSSNCAGCAGAADTTTPIPAPTCGGCSGS